MLLQQVLEELEGLATSDDDHGLAEEDAVKQSRIAPAGAATYGTNVNHYLGPAKSSNKAGKLSGPALLANCLLSVISLSEKLEEQRVCLLSSADDTVGDSSTNPTCDDLVTGSCVNDTSDGITKQRDAYDYTQVVNPIREVEGHYHQSFDGADQIFEYIELMKRKPSFGRHSLCCMGSFECLDFKSINPRHALHDSMAKPPQPSSKIQFKGSQITAPREAMSDPQTPHIQSTQITPGEAKPPQTQYKSTNTASTEAKSPQYKSTQFTSNLIVRVLKKLSSIKIMSSHSNSIDDILSKASSTSHVHKVGHPVDSDPSCGIVTFHKAINGYHSMPLDMTSMKCIFGDQWIPNQQGHSLSPSSNHNVSYLKAFNSSASGEVIQYGDDGLSEVSSHEPVANTFVFEQVCFPSSPSYNYQDAHAWLVASQHGQEMNDKMNVDLAS